MMPETQRFAEARRLAGLRRIHEAADMLWPTFSGSDALAQALRLSRAAREAAEPAVRRELRHVERRAAL